MKAHRALSEWVEQLSSLKADEVSRAEEAMTEALSSDEAVRERAAQLLVEALARPTSAGHAGVLSVLQSSWWPPTASLAGPAMQATVAVLQKVAPDSPEAEHATLLLTNICRAVPPQLATLEPLLSHEHPAVRKAAVGVVGRVGEVALPMLPKLMRCLEDPEAPVADAALESLCALASLAPDTAVPALLAHARKGEGVRRYLALTALRGLLEDARRGGQPPPRGLEGLGATLSPALKDADPAMRLVAVALLGLSPQPSTEGATALREHLGDASPDVAAYAAISLLRTRASTQEALSTLSSLLTDEAPERHGAALTALESLEPGTLAQARPVLEEAARKGAAPVRGVVPELLAALKKHATPN